ncbi:MAG TPA: iron-sulfur cluster assembly accessory protein [Candidatus Limnocylindria bacterium]
MIELTPMAAGKLRELRGDDPTRAFLRVYVAGRSCCGMQYGLSFDEQAEGDDAVSEAEGIKVAIDSQSLPYCEGAVVDYVQADLGEGFVVRNERFSGGGCSCGR